jgi:phosphoenolpyruvate carboxylase
MHSAFSTSIREDIRLLGRLLGETLKEQEGEQVFATIEGIRQLSVRIESTAMPRPAGSLIAR